MKKFHCIILAAALSIGSYSALAATTTKNADDGSAIGTSASPQVIQQNKTMDAVPMGKDMPMGNEMSNSDEMSGGKGMTKKSAMSKHSKMMKMMDTNGDGMVSKEEYMAHQEKMYEKMKQTDGGVKY